VKTRCCVAALVLATALQLAAWPAGAQSPPSSAALEPPATVLLRYEDALDRSQAPRFVRFEYAVEQVGPRNLSQTHRVYRSGLTERDEILSVDGQSLQTPSIRIIRNRVNRYNVATLAPRARDYTFSYIGEHHDGPRIDYVFSTAPRIEGGAYAVRAVTIDGVHFLPRSIAYSTTAGGIGGRGTLSFFPQGGYWMIQEATVAAKVNQKVARERLVFHNYDFPSSLPESTFVEPRSVQTTQP